jgi:hypothetical protein
MDRRLVWVHLKIDDLISMHDASRAEILAIDFTNGSTTLWVHLKIGDLIVGKYFMHHVVMVLPSTALHLSSKLMPWP